MIAFQNVAIGTSYGIDKFLSKKKKFTELFGRIISRAKGVENQCVGERGPKLGRCTNKNNKLGTWAFYSESVYKRFSSPPFLHFLMPAPGD